jgi:hypothetical protein
MLLRSIVNGLLERRLGKASLREIALATKLRSYIAGLPDVNNDSDRCEAGREWKANRTRLRKLVMTRDPRRFMEWDVIQNTMFVGNAPYIAEELRVLRASGQWRTRWKRALKEDTVGLPRRCRFHLSSSGNLIHHAYSLYRLEKETGRSINEWEAIIEYGGGYGSLCRLVRRLGFQGQYVIMDLPEMCGLQQYFLESLDIPVNEASGTRSVHCVSDRAELATRLGHSVGWLFIGLWSVSEMPLDLRRQVLTAYAGNIDSYLIAYQDQFDEVDNTGFFREWAANSVNVKWSTLDIRHLPGNQYLIGRRVR